MELKTDKAREDKFRGDAIGPILLVTGIFTRALNSSNKWESVDIVLLDKPSLLEWLRSRGGENRWVEDVVGIILGHGHLHD